MTCNSSTFFPIRCFVMFWHHLDCDWNAIWGRSLMLHSVWNALGCPSVMYVCSEDECAFNTLLLRIRRLVQAEWMLLVENIICTKGLYGPPYWGHSPSVDGLMPLVVLDATAPGWIMNVHSYWWRVVWTATLFEHWVILFIGHHETTFPYDIQLIHTRGMDMGICSGI